MNQNKVDIKEIFESIQGEGPYIGVNQLFIRFSDCNLHCKYCDTDFKSELKTYNKETMLNEIKKYKNIYRTFINELDYSDNVFPTIIPNWDHTPRSGRGGYVMTKATPEYFAQHIKHVFSVLKQKKHDRQIVFLKSWNEWGEGNYLEPDLKYGRKYLETLKDILESY